MPNIQKLARKLDDLSLAMICNDLEFRREFKDGRAPHFPNHETVAIAGAGHWPHHDRFADFIGVVNRFLG